MLTGAAILVVTLASLAATLSSGADAYAQARRNAVSATTIGDLLGQ